MFPPNTWLFDLEILNPIPGEGGSRVPGVQYCRHWGDHWGMGISVLVAARPNGADMRLYTNDVVPQIDVPIHHLSAFALEVAQDGYFVGYNSRFFDAKVLAAKGIYIPEERHYDYYAEIKKATRLAAPKGYKQDAVAQRCGGPAKNGEGAMAPILWQQGRREEVMRYCCNDITQLVAISQHAVKSGFSLPSPDGFNSIQLRYPEDVFK